MPRMVSALTHKPAHWILKTYCIIVIWKEPNSTFSRHSEHFWDQVCGFLHWTRSILQLISVPALSGVGVAHHGLGDQLLRSVPPIQTTITSPSCQLCLTDELNVSPYDFLSELNPLMIGQPWVHLVLINLLHSEAQHTVATVAHRESQQLAGWGRGIVS